VSLSSRVACLFLFACGFAARHLRPYSVLYFGEHRLVDLTVKAPGAHMVASVTFIAVLMTILIQAPTTKCCREIDVMWRQVAQRPAPTKAPTPKKP